MTEPSSEVVNAKDAQWWLCPENDKHERVLAVVRSIRMNQEYRKVTDLLHEALYGNLPTSSYGRGQGRKFAPLARLTLNVCRNMVGAVTSKIAAKNKPKPTFLTEEGNQELKEQAQNLEKFVSGVFYESGVYAELADCFRDCCVYGTGVLKAYEEDGRCVVERVRPKEIVVDDGEGADCKPRNLYQRKYYDRLVLKKLFGNGDAERERLIDCCPQDREDKEHGYQTTADQVLVTEAWHLGENEKTAGRHTVVIEGLTLVDEEWMGPFPFAFLRWTKDTEGFFGVGLVEELRGIQNEINKLLQQIQRGHHLIAGHWLVLQGTTLTTQINNDLAAIVKYTGTPPKYETPSVISPEVYQHLWQLYAKAFEITGISQLQATGMKPAGLDSGEAQRVYNDIQTERFLEVGQAFEEFVVEAARQVVRCAKRIGGSYRVRAIGDDAFTAITWADVKIDDRDYIIRVQPMSMLPSTPAGKVQWAEDRVKAGLIPPEDMLDLLDFPDTKAYVRKKNAARYIIERNVAHMLKTGEGVSPEPFDNHELALRLVNERYHEARLDGVPDEKLELLRTYMAVTQKMMPKPPPPMPPPMGPMAGPPMQPMDPMAAPPMPPMDPNAPPPMPVAA